MRKSKIALALIMSLSLATSSYAMPSGGSVAGGTASVSGIVAGTLPNGTAINVGAGSALINWDSFSIASGEKLFYDVANGGLALNYVTGSQMSELMGALTAKSAASTGTLMLVNPNGVLVGANAVINIPNLVLSSMDLDNANAFINDPTGTKLKLKDTGKNVSVEKNANAYGVAQIKSDNLQIYASCVNLADSVYLVSKNSKLTNANNAELEYEATSGLKAASINGFSANALPAGGTVVAGDADISTPGTVKVTGSSIINWDSFDIGRDATFTFDFKKNNWNDLVFVLNRVTGNTASHLYGTMKSNGDYYNSRVLLLNPNGVLIGKDAIISMPSLLLSTLDMKDSDLDNLAAGKDVKFFTNTSYANGGKGTVTMEDSQTVVKGNPTDAIRSSSNIDIYGHEVNIGKNATIAAEVDTNIVAGDSVTVSVSNKPVDFYFYEFDDAENVYLTSGGLGYVTPGGGSSNLNGARGYDIKEVDATSANKITIGENAAINELFYKDGWMDGDVTIAGGSIDMKKDSSITAGAEIADSEINVLAGNKITFTKDYATDEYVTSIEADSTNTISMDGAKINNIGSDINIMGGNVKLKDTVVNNGSLESIMISGQAIPVGDVTVAAANEIEKKTVGGTVGHGFKTSENGVITTVYGNINEMEVDYDKKTVKAPMFHVYRNGVYSYTIDNIQTFDDGKMVILDKHSPKENTGTLIANSTHDTIVDISNSKIHAGNDAVVVGTTVKQDSSANINATGGSVNVQEIKLPDPPPLGTNPTTPPNSNPPSSGTNPSTPPNSNPSSSGTNPTTPPVSNNGVIIDGTTAGSVVEAWENYDDIYRIEREISSAINALPSSFYTVENIHTIVSAIKSGLTGQATMGDLTKTCLSVLQTQHVDPNKIANVVVALEQLDGEFANANTTVKKQVAADTIAFFNYLESRTGR